MESPKVLFKKDMFAWGPPLGALIYLASDRAQVCFFDLVFSFQGDSNVQGELKTHDIEIHQIRRSIFSKYRDWKY